jgi:hypothetical protein
MITMVDEETSLDSLAPMDRDSVKRALDELFTFASMYRQSSEYLALLRFIARFHAYSPYNAMLVHVQRPGAVFVAPASRWRRLYGRRLKPGAQPLVILQPGGPVMFVFDVSDTTPEPDAPALPDAVEHPFDVLSGKIGRELPLTVDNAQRDGVDVADVSTGSQQAACITTVEAGRFLIYMAPARPQPKAVPVPLRYQIMLNQSLPPEAQYASLVHELAHLYCGHLGTPNELWWPDRQWLDVRACEFEAESVAYLICARFGLDNPSAQYLAQFVDAYEETPPISIDTIMKAAGLVEQMGRHRMPARKGDNKQTSSGA